MNIEVLKAKMADYFNNVSADYLMQKYEQMGYTFVDASIAWNYKEPLTTPSYFKVRSRYIEWYKRPFVSNKAKKQNIINPDYSGFFLLTLQYEREFTDSICV